jgi:hypothetical protein
MTSSLLIMLRVYVSHELRSTFPNQGAQGRLCRIAVWNKDKIVVVISTIIWMTDVAFLVNGKYLPHIMG